MKHDAKHDLLRTAFVTDRTQEFFTEAELAMQIGYGKALWPLVLVKELVDNALDACEMTDRAPEITVALEKDSITVSDNGPGLKPEIITKSLDYSQRISDKKYYVAPTRGQLGNALKCVFAAAFVATGQPSRTEITSCGFDHRVEVRLDRIQQRPRIEHSCRKSRSVKKGSFVKVCWPDVAGLKTHERNAEFYQSTVREALPDLILGFAALNPHASFTLTSLGIRSALPASDRGWRKWRTSDPTSAHWYRPQDLRELIAAYIRDGKRVTLRDFVGEFDGLAGTQYRKRVLAEAELTDACLADLVSDGDLDMARVERLLKVMQHVSRPVKPERLGVIGQNNLDRVLIEHGVEEGFEYGKEAKIDDDGLPYVVEIAFGVGNGEDERKLIIGLNNSPVFKVPSGHLSDALTACHVQEFDPVVLLIHLSRPRFAFTDHGKGAIA